MLADTYSFVMGHLFKSLKLIYKAKTRLVSGTYHATEQNTCLSSSKQSYYTTILAYNSNNNNNNNRNSTIRDINVMCCYICGGKR